jgi:hypothetical protein
MSTSKRYALLVAIFLIASIAAGVFYYFYSQQRSAYLAHAEALSLVASFGDELRSVSLLAPPAELAKEMDQHYAIFVHPDLLAKWKADPSLAPGRRTSSPYPDRIDVLNATKNPDGTFTVNGNIIEVARGAEGPQLVSFTKARFTLTLGPDGWQITNYEVVPAS